MKNKHNEMKKGTTAAVGIASAVIGAGVAVAATKMLTDDKTRKKMASTVSGVKNQMMDSLQSASSVMKDTKGKLEKKLAGKKKTGKKAQSAATKTKKNVTANAAEK